MRRIVIIICVIVSALAGGFFYSVYRAFNPGWTTKAEFEAPDGYTYYFMDYSVLQAQEMKLIRKRSGETQSLGSNNGDSPRSWCSVIRPEGASDQDYGQLYCTADGMIIGLRYANQCYLAYDTKTAKFYGHGDVEFISPFLLATQETVLHKPDIFAVILKVAESVAIRSLPQISVYTNGGYAPGCPRPETLKEGLSHPNDEIQKLSCWLLMIEENGLSHDSEATRELFDYLMQNIDSTNKRIRKSVLETMGYFEVPYAEKAIPYLAEAIKSADAEIASKAAYSLGNMGGKAFPVLLNALKSDSKSVRFYGMYGLRVAGPKAQPYIEQIIPMLSDKDSSVRWQTLIALNRIQCYEDELTPYLKQMLNDRDATIRREAQKLLDELKNKDANE